MRRVSISRGVAVLAITIALALPTFARPSGDEPFKPKNPIMRLIQRLVSAFGDGLIIPIP